MRLRVLMLVLVLMLQAAATGIHAQSGFRAPQCEYQESVGFEPHAHARPHL